MKQHRILSWLALPLMGALMLSACSTKMPAPTTERTPTTGKAVIVNGEVRRLQPGQTPTPTGEPNIHVVRPGETLYSIATQNNLSPLDVAAWNNIADVTQLAVGQHLRLTPPAGGDTAVATLTPTQPAVTVTPLDGGGALETPYYGSPTTQAAGAYRKTTPKAIKEPYSEQRLIAMRNMMAPLPEPMQQPGASGEQIATAIIPPERPMVTQNVPPPQQQQTAPAQPGDAVRQWLWPTQGKVISRFSESASLKGIDIVGAIGQPVVASAAGRVVYVGSGLRGYGKLVIVKHNDTYLTVYAHNREIYVKQGESVRQGQKIAEMGNSDADQVKLHFEVRQDGKPVDPLKFLPAK